MNITTQLADTLRAITAATGGNPPEWLTAELLAADRALAAYDAAGGKMNITQRLAAALQNLAETVAEICPTLDADVQSEACEALAAYDAAGGEK